MPNKKDSNIVSNSKAIKSIMNNKRNPERIDKIIKLITEIWKENSDMRFLQLIHNLTYNLKNETNFYIEDEEFEKILDDAVKIMKK